MKIIKLVFPMMSCGFYKIMRVAVFLSLFSASLNMSGQGQVVSPSLYPDNLLRMLCEKLDRDYPSPISIYTCLPLDSSGFADGCYTFRLASPHADFHFLIKYRDNYYAIVGNDTGARLASFCDFTQTVDIPDEVLGKYYTRFISFCHDSYKHSHSVSKEETDTDCCEEQYGEDIWKRIHFLCTDKYKQVAESIDFSSSLHEIFKTLPLKMLCAGTITDEDFLSICRYLDEMIKKSKSQVQG